ncbi:MAG: lipopolysaccharide heptosyltransferase II [Candidatus Omnitrophica bacterium]|nr:lipopolysaccharide heptosyltransferase II [Candidatus Omnitrophota bacterium]
MNVLQLVPKLNVGGVEVGTVDVARALTLLGNKSVVASAGGALERDLVATGSKHYNLAVGKKNPVTMFFVYRELRKIISRENIDIVHARSRIPALIGYFAARHEGKTFITTAHGQYRKHFISSIMGWGKIVIVANETMSEYMNEKFGVKKEKMVIIPRGVDLEKFQFRGKKIKKDNVIRVGMISRITPLKGHLDFIEAISLVTRKYPCVEGIIMGDMSSAKPDYITKIKLSIARLSLERVIKFKDSREKVPDVLKELDVFVSANRKQEAFGRSVIEAQAVGVPVVATRVGGVIESVKDGETGLIAEPSDPVDLAEKIIRVISSPETALSMVKNARANVEKEYSLERMLNLTISAYKNVLKMKKILVMKISSLGDIVLSVPSLRALRCKYPLSVIKVLVDIRFREALKGIPYVDEIITCDLNGRDSGRSFIKFGERLRDENFDLSVDLQNSKKSHMLAFLAFIPERYGYDNGKLSFLINRRTKMPQRPMDPLDHQLNLLHLLGVTLMEKRLELVSDPLSDEWVDEFLAANWVKDGQPIVGISLSASEKWPSKNWGLENFIRLSELLARVNGIRVVLLGAESDAPAADIFVNSTDSKPVNAVGKTTIGQLASLIKRSSVIVTGDSAPMHMAAAFNIPFVAIFGPTDPKRHLPPAEHYKLIHKRFPCSSCYKGKCPKDMRCMNMIKPQEIFEAVTELMA